jgi:hypothetical protein
LNQLKFLYSNLFRCSVDELLTHPFVKHPKKISNDPHILADDMAKILEFYIHKESNNTETDIDQLFGKKTNFFIFLFFSNFLILDDSNNKHSSINLSWEF